MGSIEISFRSTDPQGRLLCNYVFRPFVLDGVSVHCPGAFIAGLEFPEVNDLRRIRFQMHGELLLARISAQWDDSGDSVMWDGNRLKIGSAAYLGLIARAIRFSFMQNPDALEILQSTRGSVLVQTHTPHEGGRRALPPDVFCRILTSIRDGTPC